MTLHVSVKQLPTISVGFWKIYIRPCPTSRVCLHCVVKSVDDCAGLKLHSRHVHSSNTLVGHGIHTCCGNQVKLCTGINCMWEHREAQQGPGTKPL